MYDYQKERPWIFTDEGQRAVIAYRDTARGLGAEAGAFTVAALMRKADGPSDSFKSLACIDRLVEMGDIRKVFSEGATQCHVYVWRRG